jgi:hypothetical protein
MAKNKLKDDPHITEVMEGLKPFYTYENYYYGSGREKELIVKWDNYLNNKCIEEAAKDTDPD